MNLHHILLIAHLLAAAVWVGGHIFLSIGLLPTALKQNDPNIITDFEKKYEPVGMPALILLIITGVWMAYDYGVPVQQWFSFSTGIESAISTKLLLLFVTFAFAMHAQFSVLPNIHNNNLRKMAVYIITVTLIGITMLILGSTIRYGGI